jgi:hypothetical protein
MQSRLVSVVTIIGLALVAGATGSSAAEFKYIGVKKCKTCHQKELIGDQHAAWEKSKHSKAYETLKGEEAAKFAKAAGIAGPAYEAEQCLGCHVTAYGADPSAFLKNPLKVENGVQCESCHGPGSGYKKKKIMADHALSVANGMREPGKDEKICVTCHNEKSPSWDPAKGFDFEESKKAIAHPIPAEVKGRYAEAVKELKDKKGK